jgi:hypothetical protein
MHIKRNNNIPLSMADALVDLVRRYVVALDATSPRQSLTWLLSGSGPMAAQPGRPSGTALADATAML